MQRIETAEGVYYMYPHAIKRMESRGISLEQLVEALTHKVPLVILENKADTAHKRVRLRGKNGITLILKLPDHIITVWRYSREYSRSKRKEKENARGLSTQQENRKQKYRRKESRKRKRRRHN